jgi:phospho-N-acetylmuramoyl-pentapeptide-transferase
VLYHLFKPLEEVVGSFRLFQYVSFRAAFAAILAFVIATVVGPGIIESLRKRKLSGFSPTGHGDVDAARSAKASVPTMGGVILLVGVALSGFLFVRLDIPHTWIVLVSFLLFGLLGARDDWKKLTNKKGEGMSERQKLLGQLLIAGGAIAALYAVGCAEEGRPWMRGASWKPNPYPAHVVREGEGWEQLAARHLGDPARARELAAWNDRIDALGRLEPLGVGRTVKLPPPPGDHHRADLQVPFAKGFCLDLGLWFIPLGILVIVGASNAVNLTDGLDGLAIGVTATVAAAFVLVGYLVGRLDFARDLYLFHVPEGGELAIVAAALFGGSLGFLWFNAHPATVFMGDTGSLSIGGILGTLAVALRHEVTLFLAGGMFVAEALSVIIQRTYFKATKRAAIRRGDPNPTGKRFFRVAPFHHHYQQLGQHENKVTIRFWIVSVVLVVAALVALKLR